VLFGDLLHQPLANARIRLPDIPRIGEPLIAIRYKSEGLGQLIFGDPKGRSRCAEQAIGRRRINGLRP
jgi:hypothetical protein